MLRMYFLFVILLSVPVFSGCAKHYDPEEVCTGKWIKPRVDQAMADFHRKSSKAFDLLKGVSDNVAESGGLGKIQMVTALVSLASLVTDFKDSNAIRDLRILSKTCDDPRLVSKAFRGYLREQGAPDSIVNLLDQVDAFRKLIAAEEV